MAIDAPQRSMHDVSKAIVVNGKCTVFLGAGISVPAGIPSAYGIIANIGRILLKKDNINDDEVYAWLKTQDFFDQNSAYASILDAAFASENDRLAYFETEIRGKRPTTAHKSIAKMIDHGFTSIVVTTNFDRLMEYAVLKVCHHFPCVYQSDLMPFEVNMQSHRAKIFKLHGDYLYGNIRNLDHELYLVKESMSRKLSIVAREGVLLVSGYSGGDATVMEALETFAKDESAFNSGIYWLALKGIKPNEAVLRLLELTADRGSGIVEIESADEFFTSLLEDLPERTAKDHLLFRVGGQEDSTTDAPEYVSRQLDPISAGEFFSLIKRRNELRFFTDTIPGIDYLLARFEELGELPGNFAELIDRYIDFLSALKELSYDSKSDTKHEQRAKELLQLGFAEKSQDNIIAMKPWVLPYLDSLLLLQNGLELDKIGEMLDNEDHYECLRFYVGLVKDATAVVQTAVHHSKFKYRVAIGKT